MFWFAFNFKSYFHYHIHTYSKSHHTNYYPYITYYWNYYQFSERNCIVGEPRRLCIYDRVKGKILKTVDSVYQAIDSREDCEDLCNSAPFRCHSYDYNDTGDFVCRLSHHSAHTLTQIEEPYLAIGKRKFIVKIIWITRKLFHDWFRLYSLSTKYNLYLSNFHFFPFQRRQPLTNYRLVIMFLLIATPVIWWLILSLQPYLMAKYMLRAVHWLVCEISTIR